MARKKAVRKRRKPRRKNGSIMNAVRRTRAMRALEKANGAFLKGMEKYMLHMSRVVKHISEMK